MRYARNAETQVEVLRPRCISWCEVDFFFMTSLTVVFLFVCLLVYRSSVMDADHVAKAKMCLNEE